MVSGFRTTLIERSACDWTKRTGSDTYILFYFTAVTNLALSYQRSGQLARALTLFEEALPISRNELPSFSTWVILIFNLEKFCNCRKHLELGKFGHFSIFFFVIVLVISIAQVHFAIRCDIELVVLYCMLQLCVATKTVRWKTNDFMGNMQ